MNGSMRKTKKKQIKDNQFQTDRAREIDRQNKPIT